jgi:hypothetical protein
VSNRLCNAAHQARTLLPPHRIGALPWVEYSHKNYSAEGCIQPVTNGLARPAHRCRYERLRSDSLRLLERVARLAQPEGCHREWCRCPGTVG